MDWLAPVQMTGNTLLGRQMGLSGQTSGARTARVDRLRRGVAKPRKVRLGFDLGTFGFTANARNRQRLIGR